MPGPCSAGSCVDLEVSLELAASAGFRGAVGSSGAGAPSPEGSSGPVWGTAEGNLKGSGSARPRRLGVRSSARAPGSSRMASRAPGFIGGESCSRLGLSSEAEDASHDSMISSLSSSASRSSLRMLYWMDGEAGEGGGPPTWPKVT